jgi:hypothetical protein
MYLQFEWDAPWCCGLASQRLIGIKELNAAQIATDSTATSCVTFRTWPHLIWQVTDDSVVMLGIWRMV